MNVVTAQNSPSFHGAIKITQAYGHLNVMRKISNKYEKYIIDQSSRLGDNGLNFCFLINNQKVENKIARFLQKLKFPFIHDSIPNMTNVQFDKFVNKEFMEKLRGKATKIINGVIAITNSSKSNFELNKKQSTIFHSAETGAYLGSTETEKIGMKCFSILKSRKTKPSGVKQDLQILNFHLLGMRTKLKNVVYSKTEGIF